MTWDGVERRMNQRNEDHDNIIEIKNDVKHLCKHVSDHVKDDKTAFTKIEKDINWIQKIVYGGLGIVAFIELAAKFVK